MGLDGHSYTKVVVNNCLIVHYFNRPVRVLGYDPTEGSREFKVVSAVILWYQPQTCQVYMLIINE